jgi:hypothetical protein
MDDKDKTIQELRAATAAKDEALREAEGAIRALRFTNASRSSIAFEDVSIKIKHALSLDCGKAITEELHSLRVGLNASKGEIVRLDGELKLLQADKERLERSLSFYSDRCANLQKAQSSMRDPERKWVCDILANGYTDVARAITLPKPLYPAPKQSRERDVADQVRIAPLATPPKP